MFTRSHTSRFLGFTLIELLVVIAIIAILASLRLPSLNRAVSRELRSGEPIDETSPNETLVRCLVQRHILRCGVQR